MGSAPGWAHVAVQPCAPDRIWSKAGGSGVSSLLYHCHKPADHGELGCRIVFACCTTLQHPSSVSLSSGQLHNEQMDINPGRCSAQFSGGPSSPRCLGPDVCLCANNSPAKSAEGAFCIESGHALTLTEMG